MDNFLQAVTSDFEFIAKKTEFKFNKYSEETVNWENLGNFIFESLLTS